MRTKLLTTSVVLVAVALILITATAVYAALTKAAASVTDWNACAVQTGEESGIISFTGNYAGAIMIQAFLDTTTAHEGTQFIVQVSFATSGDEDWADYTQFLGLVGTANSEAILDNPLAATSTTIDVADTGGGYETEPMGKWIAIEDGTLANSELVWLTDFAADDEFYILDGTTNEHAQGVLCYDIAFSRTVVLDMSVLRARVVINNGWDMDGTASSLNYRVREAEVTVIQ